MPFSPKQQEFLNLATKRWNIKSGATRSGKTYLDYFVIPKRLKAIRGKEGLRVFLGNTQGTIERNIIKPLQALWGTQLVSDIRSDNTCRAFGDEVYCLGADKKNAIDRIRGSSWAYLYGDEVATWHPGVFDMAKSRLDKSYSRADLTCNPEQPSHWFKQFIDSDADIFAQHYTIDDNTYNDPIFVENLKREYRGTVYYDRYILGKWVKAEGRVYPTFEKHHIIDKVPSKIHEVKLGLDFGGNKSATAGCAVGYYFDAERRLCLVILDELYDTENRGVGSVLAKWQRFYEKQAAQYTVTRSFADSAEQLIIKSLRELPIIYTENAMKRPIVDRIRLEDILFSTGRLHIMSHCKHTIAAFDEAVYNDKSQNDERLDDGTSNIDSLDAFEYAIERDMSELIRGAGLPAKDGAA